MTDDHEWQRVQAHLRLDQATPETLRALLGGISQPSLSRRLQRWRPALRQLGRGPASRYALARTVAGLDEVPVFRISAAGEAQQIGRLLPCQPGDSLWFESGIDAEQDQSFADLPWWLNDQRPNGFLGRLYAEQWHDSLLTPRDPRNWNSSHVLTALSTYGEDMAGNLILGERSLNRWLQHRARAQPPISEAQRQAAYADVVFAHQQTGFGSSAAGEQPKFCASVVNAEGAVRHVIVKYSAADGSAGATRWRDLLRAEVVALQALGRLGVPIPPVQLLEGGGRVFLESERFDRIGERGRHALFSLGSIDDEFYGLRNTDWVAAGRRLHSDRRLSADDYRLLRMQAVFGALIGNTDQHYGNVSLQPIGAELSGHRFQLAPAYDCLPMLFRPTETNEVVERTFLVTPATADTFEEWPLARGAACEYWQQISDDLAFSDLFRRIAEHCGEALRRA